jgi:hypothetical protein
MVGVLAGYGGYSLALWKPSPVPAPSSPAARAACDRAIEALLHSSDLVEVTRGGIIIRELNCDIAGRLEKAAP